MYNTAYVKKGGEKKPKWYVIMYVPTLTVWSNLSSACCVLSAT
jgi:hypothetical protein